MTEYDTIMYNYDPTQCGPVVECVPHTGPADVGSTQAHGGCGC